MHGTTRTPIELEGRLVSNKIVRVLTQKFCITVSGKFSEGKIFGNLVNKLTVHQLKNQALIT